MVRHNAAHRGAERDVFPHLDNHNPGVVSNTATRWTELTGKPGNWPRDGGIPDVVPFRSFQSARAHVSHNTPNGREFTENIAALLSMICCAGVMTANGQPHQLKNFDQLRIALRNGTEVRAVIDYARCTLIADSVETRSPEAIGGLPLGTFEYFAKMSVRNAKSFVSSSQTVLISHPRYGHVFNYVKLKIYDDNTVEITARYLSPTIYQIVMDETFYVGISSGSDNMAVALYER